MRNTNWIYYYAGFFLIFAFLQFVHAGNMFLKLDGETIMGHDYSQHDDYTIEIPGTVLAENGLYKYKYTSGQLVGLSDQEIKDHPLAIEKEIKKAMREEEVKSERTSKINRGGVNSNLLYLIKRLRPGIRFTVDVKVSGDGKSVYERLRMIGKPTFQQLQAELGIYKTELINALSD